MNKVYFFLLNYAATPLFYTDHFVTVSQLHPCNQYTTVVSLFNLHFSNDHGIVFPCFLTTTQHHSLLQLTNNLTF